MPTYTQRVEFSREFTITAKDANAANDRLDELVREVEFSSDVRCRDGVYLFEDDPVECPKCKGACVNENDENCPHCHGEGSVPFVADKEAA